MAPDELAADVLLDTLLTTAPVGFGFLDPGLRYVRVNAALAAMNGLPPEDHLGRTVGEVVPFLASELEPLLRQVLRTGEPIVNREVRGEAVAGEQCWRLESCYPVWARDGRTVGIGVTVVDITEQKRTQEQLRRSRQELIDFVENATVALHWVGPDGRILWANQAELDLLGYTRDEYVGRHIAEFHADPPAIDDILGRLGANEALHNYQARLRARDGSIKHVLISSNVLWEAGKFVHTRCFTRDVTDRVRAEQSRALLARAGEVLASSLDWEMTLDHVTGLTMPALADFGFFDVVEADGQVRRIARAHDNPRKQAILEGTRWVRSDRTDINVCALSSGRSGFHPDIADAWLQDVAVGPEHLAVMRDLAFCSMITVPLCYGERILGALTLFYAESGRRHTEADLAFAEELARRAATAVENARLFKEAQEAIRIRDEFLSVASHELRTPLTSLRGYAQLLLRRAGGSGTLDQERVVRSLQAIEEQSDKLARLISQLLDVSRLEAGKLAVEREPTDLAALAERVAEDARARTTRHAIAVRADGPIRAPVDSLRLEQVLTNLLDNAIRYSPQGGPIDVELSQPSIDMVQLAVRDRGLGIPPERRDRIFDRFYQAHTHDNYSGLGLGLHISRQIVELHGGELDADFPPDGGSRFLVRLPVVEDEPAAISASSGDRQGPPADPVPLTSP